MQKKKEKFLGKVIKKNYNNELEYLLENKSFDENAKNLLLSILYKLEVAYNDYEQVKKNVMPKDDFLQKIIEIIDKYVEDIKLIKIGTKDAKILGNKSFLVDKEKRKIICYPIETKLLFALAQISKRDKIIKEKYSVINETLSDLINIANDINSVEPMRDFNGFSWSIVSKDIESLEHNLIYQNLVIIVGSEFLSKWIYNKEFIIDYYESFQNKLEECYGNILKKELIDTICILSIILKKKYDSNNIQHLMIIKGDIEKKIKEIEDKEELIKKLTIEKKKINKQIKEKDTIISDKNLLQNEYIMRNNNLPLDKKIFSLRVLAKIMREERQVLMEKKSKINKMLNPKKFVKYQEELEEKYKYLKYLNETNLEETIQNQLIILQKLFLQCLKKNIEKAQTKSEVYDLIREFRYYLNIPISKNKKVLNIKQINKEIEEIKELLIKKAIEIKLLTNISNNQEINFKILKEIFNTKIIELQGINIKLSNENEILNLQMFDENIFEEKIELSSENSPINTKEFLIKFNKTIKIFNN